MHNSFVGLSLLVSIVFAGAASAWAGEPSSAYLRVEREKRAALENLADCMLRLEGRKIEQVIAADPETGAFDKWEDGHSFECYLHVMKDLGVNIRPDPVALEYALAEALFRRGGVSSRGIENLGAIPALSQGISNYRPRSNGPLTRAEEEARREQNQRALYLSIMAECIVRDDAGRTVSLLSSKAWTAEEDRAFEVLKPAISDCVAKTRNVAIDRQNLRGALALNYLRLAHARPQQPFLRPGLTP